MRAWEFGSAPCGWVFALSVDPEARLGGVGSALMEAISRNFREAGIDNVSLHCMDALASLPDGQFDAILVSGSMPRLEQRLIDSLMPGGSMFVRNVHRSAPQ